MVVTFSAIWLQDHVWQLQCFQQQNHPVSNFIYNFIYFIFTREGVRGGAGWATAPPKICLTKGKNLYFRKYSKNLVISASLRPTRKKILMPSLLLFLKSNMLRLSKNVFRHSQRENSNEAKYIEKYIEGGMWV